MTEDQLFTHIMWSCYRYDVGGVRCSRDMSGAVILTIDAKVACRALWSDLRMVLPMAIYLVVR